MRSLRVSVVASLLTLVSVVAEVRAAPADSGSGSGGGWISTRLSVGARFTYYWLEETRRSGENGYDNGNLSGNFLGSLWGLDAQQHYFPNPYFEYRVSSGFGIGAMYDQLRVKTLDWANHFAARQKWTTFAREK